MNDIPQCAHLRVYYVRVHHGNRTCSDRWECQDCHKPFWPETSAALPPCSPATPQQSKALPGRSSRLTRLVSWAQNKIKTILRGPQTPSSDADIRQALHICIFDAVPPITGEEFEKLYIQILDDRFYNKGLDAEVIIDRFLSGRKI